MSRLPEPNPALVNPRAALLGRLSAHEKRELGYKLLQAIRDVEYERGALAGKPPVVLGTYGKPDYDELARELADLLQDDIFSAVRP